MNEPLVLIPGLGCDSRLFETQTCRLGLDRVIILCLPVLSDRVEDMAARLLTRLPPKFALAGHCLGGAVAMEMLRLAPERVTRIAVISAAILPEPTEVAAARDLLIAKARGGRLDDALAEALPVRALAQIPGRLNLHRRFLSMGDHLGLEHFVSQQRAMQRRPDNQATLRRARLPALFLFGEADRLVPAGRNALLAELLPGARIIVLSEAGHLPPLEQPDAVTAAMEHWLFGHDRQPLFRAQPGRI